MLKPLKTKIIVKKEDNSSIVEENGLIYQKKTDTLVDNQVVVVAIGASVTDVKVGDKILHYNYHGNTIVHNDETYIVMDEADVAVILEGE